MIDHFEFKVVDLLGCIEFYSLVLIPLGIEKKWSDDAGAGFGMVADDSTKILIEKSEWVSKVDIAFRAAEKSVVDEFHSQGIENGYVCNGMPGYRKNYVPNYYAAFLLDPDGNSIGSVTYG